MTTTTWTASTITYDRAYRRAVQRAKDAQEIAVSCEVAGFHGFAAELIASGMDHRHVCRDLARALEHQQ